MMYMYYRLPNNTIFPTTYQLDGKYILDETHNSLRFHETGSCTHWLIQDNWGLLINGKSYFPNKDEFMESFLNRIIDLVNKEQIEYHNYKITAILNNID